LTRAAMEDLIQCMHFVERTSAKIHGLDRDQDVYRTLIDEFRKSGRYCGALFLLEGRGPTVRIYETSLFEDMDTFFEKMGVGQCVELERAGPLRLVLGQGRTIQADIESVLAAFSPETGCCRTLRGVPAKHCVITPIYRSGRIVGALAVSASRMPMYLIPSVKNLAAHVSLALEIIDARERYRELVANIQVGIYRYSLGEDEGFEEVNPAMVEIFGARERSELLSRQLGCLFEDADQWEEFKHDLLQNGSVKNREARLRTISGTSFWGCLSAVLKGSEEGAFFDGTVHDITERKRAENQLKEARALYQGVVSNVAVGIVVANERGEIVEFNPVAEKIYGVSRAEALRMSLWDLASKVSAAAGQPGLLQKAFLRAARSGEVRDKPMRIEISVRGQSRIVEARVSTITTPTGRLFIQVADDVTEREMLREALERSEAQYRGIFNSAIDAFIIFDLRGRVVEVNPEACKMYGYSREEFIGMHASRIVHPDYHHLMGKFVRDVQEKGEFHEESVDLRRDGTPIYVEVRGTRIQYEGQPHLLAVIRDITARKKAQMELEVYSKHLEELVEKRTREIREAQEKLILSERLAAIGQTAAMVGHDLSSPLQAIKNYLFLARRALLSEEYSPKKQDEVSKNLDRINEQVKFMERIVSDLKELSRPTKLQLAPTDPESLVDDVLRSVSIPPKIKVSKKVMGLARPIMADAHLIKRVLTNLVKNAVDAMPEGGTISVAIQFSETRVEIRVADSGVGIPPERMKKLFQPFFTTKKHGQGFGLAICKRVVEAHGGSITVESKVGRGTTFTVTLPVKPTAAEESTSSSLTGDVAA